MWADPGEINEKSFLSTIHLFSQSISFQPDRSSELDNATKTLRLSAETFFAQTFLAFHPGFLNSRFVCKIIKTEEYFFLKEKNESSVIYPVVQLAYQWRHIWQGGITPIINIFIIVINDVWLFFQCPGRGIIIIIIIIIILRLGDCLTTKATGSGCHQVKSISITKILTLWRLSIVMNKSFKKGFCWSMWWLFCR